MGAPSSPVACARCGALNDLEFGACIRCGNALNKNSAIAVAPGVPVRHLRVVPASLRPPPTARPSGLRGTGAEPLLGRWPASDLPAARALLVVNLLVYALHLIFAWQREPSLDTLLSGGHAMEAVRFGALPLGNLDIVLAQPWRLLTACFVHFGVVHVGMNMMGMVYLGRICEPMVGSVRMFISYVVSGLFGFAVSLVWHLSVGGGVLTAGASGALFGLLGLVLGVLLRQRDPRWKGWLMQIGVSVLLVVVLMPSANHAAHIGGLLAGTLCGYAMGKGAPQPSTKAQRALAAALAFACIATLIWAPLSLL